MDRPLDVVIVEDDDGDALLVQGYLREADPNITMHWHRTIADAAPHLSEFLGCVLLDLDLVETFELDALREIQQLAPRAAVVVFTDLADRQIGLRALAAGAHDYVVKGEVDGPLLARSMRYARERKRADEAARTAYEASLRAEENRRLERGLLPRPVLGDESVECVVRYRPGGRRLLLGGDFYDTVQTPDGRLHVMIGDVCGHGPDEAALGVSLRIAWRTLVLAEHPPERVLSTLDDVLVHERNEAGLFVTLCDLTIEPDRRTARVVVAGHPSPVLVRPALGEFRIESRGPTLGLVAGGKWPIETLDLPPAWTILLYTDGLIEGHVPQSTARLGTEGLLDLIEANQEQGGADMQVLAESLIAQVETFNGGPLTDDVALLLVSHAPPKVTTA